MKKIKQFEIWIADLNPRFGTEAGKRRPVCIIQTDLLNNTHPSTIICPITTKLETEARLLRVHIPKGQAGMNQSCEIMIDQVRAIDNIRLIKKAGNLSKNLTSKIKENLAVVFDLIV